MGLVITERLAIDDAHANARFRQRPFLCIAMGIQKFSTAGFVKTKPNLGSVSCLHAFISLMPIPCNPLPFI